MTTFVAVHGAFTGGWYWARVRSLLRADGHEMFTPSLTGAGERAHLLSRSIRLATHVDDILNLLRYEDLRDIVLVGHSYGGMVITAVADQAPERLARLVYLDAAYPVNGQNAAGGFAEGTGDRLEALSASSPDDQSWLLPPLPLAAYGVTDPADIEWIGDRRVPHPLATLQEPVVLRHAASLPRTYLRCTQRQGLVDLFGADPLLPMYERAVADGLAIASIDAGHDAMVTAPRQVADALTHVSRDHVS